MNRPDGRIVIRAPGAKPETPYVRSLAVNGKPSDKAWLPASFVGRGGTLDFELTEAPDRRWGSTPPRASPAG